MNRRSSSHRRGLPGEDAVISTSLKYSCSCTGNVERVRSVRGAGLSANGISIRIGVSKHLRIRRECLFLCCFRRLQNGSKPTIHVCTGSRMQYLVAVTGKNTGMNWPVNLLPGKSVNRPIKSSSDICISLPKIHPWHN